VAEEYGVWGEKSIFGIKHHGIHRTTFVIDEVGRVAKVFEKVKSAGHGDEVAAALAGTPSASPTPDLPPE
jgi:peroxiredoxin Q/BCP